MDGVEDLGTVATNTCLWEYPAVVRGRKLLREKGCGMVKIGEAAWVQDGFEIRNTPPDGYCALHSVSLGHFDSPADSSASEEYREEIELECIDEVSRCSGPTRVRCRKKKRGGGAGQTRLFAERTLP